MWHRRGVFDLQVTEERPGYISCIVQGKAALEIFLGESGGHRWQRVPPTEKRGRVQTSTVTVAVFDSTNSSESSLDMRDVEISTTTGSGPGGQARNKTQTCVIVFHRPSGLQIRVDNERSQHQNRATALKMLSCKLKTAELERQALERSLDRKEQVGSGMRGDKIRTYREQDDQVIDHVSGRKSRLSDWVRGNWS